MAKQTYEQSRNDFLEKARENDAHPINFFDLSLSQERRVRNLLWLLGGAFFFYFILFSGFSLEKSSLVKGFLWTIWNTVPILLNIINEHKRYMAKQIGVYIKRRGGHHLLNEEFRVQSAYAYAENRRLIFLIGFWMFFTSVIWMIIDAKWPETELGTSLLISMGVAFILIVFSVIVAWMLAKQNKVFTFVKELTAVVVIRGGSLQKVLISMRGRYLDKINDVVPSIKYVPDIPAPHSFLQKTTSLLSLGGLRFMGLPMDELYVFRIRTREIVTNESASNERDRFKIIERLSDPTTDIPLGIQVLDYWIIRAETDDKAAVEALFRIFIVIVNPGKYIFITKDIYNAVQGIIEPVLRDIIAKEPIEQLIKDRQRIKNIIDDAVAADKNSIGKLDENFGTEIFDVEFWNFDPSRQETVDALEAPWQAEQAKRVIMTQAEAEKERIQRIYNTINSTDHGREIFAQEVLRQIGESGKGIYFVPAELTQLVGSISQGMAKK